MIIHVLLTIFFTYILIYCAKNIMKAINTLNNDVKFYFIASICCALCLGITLTRLI